MTNDQIKESISREFLRILANGHGFKVIEPSQDHGVDMIICPVTTRIEPSGKQRFLDSQYKLDFQLKATTVNGIIDAGNDIRFDLEAKNYNDLVERKDDFLPLHLLIVVLNIDPPTCILLDDQRLSIVGKAFWYLPDNNATPTNNAAQIRITIPKANQVSNDFVQNRYTQLGIDL